MKSYHFANTKLRFKLLKFSFIIVCLSVNCKNFRFKNWLPKNISTRFFYPQIAVIFQFTDNFLWKLSSRWKVIILQTQNYVLNYWNFHLLLSVYQLIAEFLNLETDFQKTYLLAFFYSQIAVSFQFVDNFPNSYQIVSMNFIFFLIYP